MHLAMLRAGRPAHRGQGLSFLRNVCTENHGVVVVSEVRPMNPLSTCDQCDAHKSERGDGFRILPPVFRDYGARTRFNGSVVTIQCFEDNTSVREAVQSAGAGRVLVVDGGGSLRRALLGGNLAGAALSNGWAGVVIHGAVRDQQELARCDIGIRALALMPLPTERRHAGLTDVPIQIQGVWVRPGDQLVADEDGIVLLATAPR
jgi:regulator of ribonuclease activity A